MEEGYYIKTEMAGTGHVYTKQISRTERVEGGFESTSHPGKLESVGKVTFVFFGSKWENFDCATLPEAQRAVAIGEGPSVEESC
jgi:hypothetical protein